MAALRKRKADSEAGLLPTSQFPRSPQLNRKQGVAVLVLHAYPHPAVIAGQVPAGAEGYGLTHDGYSVLLKAIDPTAANLLLEQVQLHDRVSVRNARVTVCTPSNPHQSRLAEFQIVLSAESQVCIAIDNLVLVCSCFTVIMSGIGHWHQCN